MEKAGIRERVYSVAEPVEEDAERDQVRDD
jgi:hypothetical protein